ncbi:MAG: hypothetical protein GX780_04870 [Campylobacteraceae bacterium]|nr:hypothetical protein [Campylobacteraceae bacterium]
MRVEQNELTNSLIQAAKATKPKTDEFSAELERQMVNTLKTQKNEDASKSESSSFDVDAFKQQLSSMGAVVFVQHQNMEKIEKLLEDKRKELEERLGLNKDANPPLSEERRANALIELEEMLNSFAKELKEQMKAKALLEKNESPLDSLLRG